MTAITFDTLKFSNRLKSAGVPEKQAEAEAEALAEVLELNMKEVATRDDIRREMEGVKNELHRALADSRADIIKWVAGLLLAQAALVAALVKLL